MIQPALGKRVDGRNSAHWSLLGNAPTARPVSASIGRVDLLRADIRCMLI